MDVRLIEIYQAVMTYGTTSRAAEVLSMSQPAVSKGIMALERSIGFKLFDREKGRMTPSAEGHLFYREVQISLAGIAKLRSAAARIRDYGSGDVRVACLSAFSTNILPKAIAAFRRKNPEVAVSLTVSGSSAIRDMIAANQLDLAVTADEVDRRGVEAMPFASIQAMLAIPSEHPLAEKQTVYPADLDRVPFIALAPEDTTRHEAEEIFAKYEVTPEVVVETAYSSTVCALVQAGVGCGIVDPVTAVGYENRGLVLRPLVPSVAFRTLLLFPNQQKSKIVQDFTRCLWDARDGMTG